MPAILPASCPPNLNAASMTEISVAVVSMPANAHQSVRAREDVANVRRWGTEREKKVKRTVHDETCADDVGPSVDGPGDEGDLEQRGQFVLVLDARLGVHERALVREAAVRADEHVVGDRLSEDLDLEHVCDDLLGLAVNVGVDERDIVVARDDVAQGREALLDPLHGDGVGERVAQVLELLVGRRARHEQAMPVAGDESADDPRATDRSLDDGHDVA